MAETMNYTIQNPVGLYVDVVNEITAVAGRFDSKIYMTYLDRTVNLKSVMGVLSLGVPAKAQLTFRAEGVDAKDALQIIKNCLEQLKV